MATGLKARWPALLFGLAVSSQVPDLSVSAQAVEPGFSPIEIKQHALGHFRIDHEEQTRFGALEYLDGYVLTSKNPQFGAISGLLSLEGGDRMLAVSDTGYWFTWRLENGPTGKAGAITQAAFAPILGKQGEPLVGKAQSDAEALTIRKVGGAAEYLVSFEGNPRIASWPASPSLAAVASANPVDPGWTEPNLGRNKGIEGLAAAPDGSEIAGAAIAFAERGKNPGGDMDGWIFGGPAPGSLKVKRRDNYDLTDAAFLPDGDLLILERRFNSQDGLGMRIRRIPGPTVRPGARLDGPAILEADYWEYQIDNMEALAVHQAKNGDVILTIMSDNNHLIVQRTLLLRFRLTEGAAN